MQLSLFENPVKDFKAIPYRIPYQGAKHKIAGSLLDKMMELKPKAKYFYDLCGGGGSMSFLALQYGLKVIYNEYDRDMATFMQYLINRITSGERSKFGLFPEDWYNFVDREKFFEVIKEKSPYSTFVSIVYSFGNSRRCYAFGKDIERQKFLGHNIVIFQCEKSLQEFNDMFQVNFTISNEKNWNDRRLHYRKEWGQLINSHPLILELKEKGFIKTEQELTTAKKKELRALYSFDEFNKIQNTKKLQNLEKLQKLQNLENLENLERLQKLEKLQNLIRLKQLENLEQLERLPAFTILNKSYDEVEIITPPEETIIYLDPPYRNTAAYKINKQNAFDHEKLDNWFRNLPYQAFMSEYTAPFESVFAIQKQKTFKNANLDKRAYATEKLFINKPI